MRQLVDADSISMVGVPLVRDEDVLGALALGRVTERELAFSALECEVLELLAGQTALALANAQLLDEVSQLAIRDELTGLFNRRHFSATFDHLLQRRARERGPKPSVVAVMFDLDYFGHFNKEHGHQAGDAVLRTFAAILRGRFRASDLLARYGGEEFVVILEDATLEDATQIADEIRRELETSAIEGPEGPRCGRRCLPAAPGSRTRSPPGRLSSGQRMSACSWPSGRAGTRSSLPEALPDPRDTPSSIRAFSSSPQGQPRSMCG